MKTRITILLAALFVSFNISFAQQDEECMNNLSIFDSYVKTKKYDEALKCFKKAINIDSNFLQAYNNIGTISLELGNIKDAIFNYEKVLQISPNNFISYKNLLATYENSNQIENYAKTLKLTKKKFPNEKILELYKGILFFRKKKFKESIKYLDKISFIKENETEIKRIFFSGKSL